MILGIIAGVRAAGSEAAAPIVDFDFLTNAYTIDGVTVSLADVFETSSEPDNDYIFDEAAIFADRGLFVNDTNMVSPVAKGALKALLLAPYTAFIEYEDIQEDCSDLSVYMAYLSTFLNYQAVAYINPNGAFWLRNGIPGYTQIDGNYPSTLVWGSTNRIAWSMGTTEDNIVLGTQLTLANPSVDGTGIFDDMTFLDVAPFGTAQAAEGQVGPVYIRKLKIFAPQPASALLTLADQSDLPQEIVDGFTAVPTDTTIALTFDDAPNATSHEYWIIESSFSASPDVDNNQYTPLPEDRIITGLDPSTDYVVVVRGRNASGPGPLTEYADAYIITTTA